MMAMRTYQKIRFLKSRLICCGYSFEALRQGASNDSDNICFRDLIEKYNKRTKLALYRSPDNQTSLSQLAFRFKRSSIQIFKMAAILDFQSERFELLLI